MITTQNQQKCRISLILGIAADGSKLNPLIIFKAKIGGLIEKNLLKNKYVLPEKYLISVNQNAWATDSIIKEWFYKIWIKYLKDEENLCDGLGFLILDKATSHLTPKVLEAFNNNNQYLSFIPAGLTLFIQPLDVVINKPFKDALRKKYIEYSSISHNINAKISREKMIEFICDTWYDPSIITTEMIIKSFQCTGIIYSLYQDKDIFIAWRKMNEEISFINDDLGEDFGEEEKKAMQEEMDIDSD